MKMYGIYAHRNVLNDKIFYVGQQSIDNNRAYNFKTRSKRYLEYIDKIGKKTLRSYGFTKMITQ